MFHVEQTKEISMIPCPVCGNNNYLSHLFLEDYFLTKEKFTIIKCEKCGLLVTHPQPPADTITKYYNSTKYISHSTRSKNFFDIFYGFIRNKTIHSKIKLINKYAKGKKLLDIGCATGIFLDACRKNGYQVEGIEPGEIVRQFATEKFNLNVYDVEYLKSYEPSTFDIITMWHVLEHVDDINERMSIINKILKVDGTALIALPNPSSYDAKYYKEHWAAYDVPRHLYHFSQNAFNTLAQKHSFKVIDILPMQYDSYYISLLSEKYKNGCAPYLKAAYLGLLSNISANKNNLNYSSLIYVIKKG